MSDLEKSPQLKMPWRRAVAGSFLAGLFGCVVMNGYLMALFLRQHESLKGNIGFTLVAAFSALFVLVVWLAVLMPIYHGVSSESVIWRWPISTLLGAVSSWVVMAIFFASSTPNHVSFVALLFQNPYNWLAGLCGGSIGLFAGLTARYFHANRPR
jgi:glucan phosphoethanolaminetransferase (alkaline phosphatase superfamily)